MLPEPHLSPRIVCAICVDLLLLPIAEGGIGTIYIYAVGSKVGSSWICLAKRVDAMIRNAVSDTIADHSSNRSTSLVVLLLLELLLF